jgi:son of sevenless-like protein
LTGQVEKTSDEPVAFGTSNDIYKGKWLNKENVALRRPRMLANTADVHRRLKNEVQLWRQFNHPNVTPLYGMVYIGDHIYTVSPWMDHGNSLTYLQEYPTADRLRILSEVASGTLDFNPGIGQLR